MEEYQKRGYLLENFRLFHLRSEQHAQVDYHYHEFCKLLMLVSGRGSYVVAGQRYLLQPGDMVLIGSRSIHRPELENGVPYERIIIYISPSFLQQVSTVDCDLPALFSGEYGHVLRTREADRKRFFGLAADLEQILSKEGYGRTLLSSAALLQLLVHIGLEQRREDRTDADPVMPKNARVLEWMQYLDAHLAEDLNMDHLAEAFYISKYHMMRLFRSETGYTIHTYLQQRRLMRSRELIEGGMRATEACYRCGFRSYSSFTRAYSKYFGTTPTGRPGAAQERAEGYE